MQIEKFRVFMEGYTKFMEEMAAGENDKYAALVSYDHKRVDRAVAGQQALNMRLTQLAEQRELEQEKAGLAGLTFQQILHKLDGEDKQQMHGIFQRFENAVNEVKYFNAKALAFAQQGLEMTGAIVEDTPAAPYGADGKRPDNTQKTNLFEAKV